MLRTILTGCFTPRIKGRFYICDGCSFSIIDGCLAKSIREENKDVVYYIYNRCLVMSNV